MFEFIRMQGLEAVTLNNCCNVVYLVVLFKLLLLRLGWGRSLAASLSICSFNYAFVKNNEPLKKCRHNAKEIYRIFNIVPCFRKLKINNISTSRYVLFLLVGTFLNIQFLISTH